MANIEKPDKLQDFIHAIMKEASSDSLLDVLAEWDIDEEELNGIEEWFKSIGINLF